MPASSSARTLAAVAFSASATAAAMRSPSSASLKVGAGGGGTGSDDTGAGERSSDGSSKGAGRSGPPRGCAIVVAITSAPDWSNRRSNRNGLAMLIDHVVVFAVGDEHLAARRQL